MRIKLLNQPTDLRHIHYTVGRKKEANLVKNQPILMLFSPLNLKTNGTCQSMTLVHLIY